MSRDYLITAPADKTGPLDFFRAITGQPPRTPAEIEEANARYERIRVCELIEKAEYLQARREREKIMRGGILDGETYAEFHVRLNGPLCRAADRVNRKVAELNQRRAA